ncbi:hypothetical protein AAFF_G00113550 [Aldrovandia affinis]|uniref:Uncharacterized protein n=1 Tax=Aldrovandia affinis TaxID=143900 RepID=A0AAD7RVQ2_9TELE|nr:hypothetical protein AAFF_G00113550 [Aldrovandia affinis]
MKVRFADAAWPDARRRRHSSHRGQQILPPKTSPSRGPGIVRRVGQLFLGSATSGGLDLNNRRLAQEAGTKGRAWLLMVTPEQKQRPHVPADQYAHEPALPGPQSEAALSPLEKRLLLPPSVRTPPRRRQLCRDGVHVLPQTLVREAQGQRARATGSDWRDRVELGLHRQPPLPERSMALWRSGASGPDLSRPPSSPGAGGNEDDLEKDDVDVLDQSVSSPGVAPFASLPPNPHKVNTHRSPHGPGSHSLQRRRTKSDFRHV